ncbi:MAG: YfhO family protein, partial [Clostridia bacterium]|nr:YfhO family protein [Clostridia bacterium]
LGVNFLGSYGLFLIGSPFFWLTIPFPSNMVPYLMGPLLILKLSFMSLTSYLYFSRFVRPRYALLGGIMYAFCGFSMYNIFFNHFHEAMVYIPFILYSLERYMDEGKRGWFAFSIFLTAMNNYYFFIGQVVFLLIYWGIRMASGCWKVTPQKVILLFLEASLGTMAAGVLLLPSFFSVIQNSRTSSLLAGQDALIYNQPQRLYDIIHSYFFPSDIPARPNFFPDAKNQWGSMSAWIPMFGCTGAIAYFQTKKHKDWLHRLLIVLVIMSLVPFLNAIFQLLNWQYYARWFYMLTLMMILATIIMLNQKGKEEVNWNRAFGWSSGITAFFVIFVGLMPKDWKAEKWEFGFEQYKDRFWIYVTIVTIGLIAAYFLVDYKKKNEKMFYSWTVLCLAVISLVYSWYILGLGQNTATYPANFVIERAIRGKDKVQLPNTDEWARIDVYECMDNLGIYWEIPCIQAFHSVVPGSIMDFYESVGVKRSVGSRPEPSHYGLRSLLSTKWEFEYADTEAPLLNRGSDKKFYKDGKADNDMPGYKLVSTTNGFNVYENTNFVSMGFAYDSYITRSEYDRFDEQKREFLMLKTLVVEDAYEDMVKDILPKVSAGSFHYEYEDFVQDCQARNAQSCSSFVPTSKGFTAEITLDKRNVVFFSAPYEKNAWEIKVNGEPAKLIRCNVGFMAVECPEGTSQISFRYHTPGLTEGIIFTFVAIFLFNMYLVVSKKKPRRVKKVSAPAEKPENPEEP